MNLRQKTIGPIATLTFALSEDMTTRVDLAEPRPQTAICTRTHKGILNIEYDTPPLDYVRDIAEIRTQATRLQDTIRQSLREQITSTNSRMALRMVGTVLESLTAGTPSILTYSERNASTPTLV